MTIQGVLTQLSDRDRKQGIEPVDPGSLLERVARLPLATWSYQGDDQRHIGPMAQDVAPDVE